MAFQQQRSHQAAGVAGVCPHCTEMSCVQRTQHCDTITSYCCERSFVTSRTDLIDKTTPCREKRIDSSFLRDLRIGVTLVHETVYLIRLFRGSKRFKWRRRQIGHIIRGADGKLGKLFGKTLHG